MPSWHCPDSVRKSPRGDGNFHAAERPLCGKAGIIPLDEAVVLAVLF